MEDFVVKTSRLLSKYECFNTEHLRGHKQITSILAVPRSTKIVVTPCSGMGCQIKSTE